MKGHIRKRGKNSWAIILDLGRDTSGRRKQKWHTVRGPKRHAEAELARLLTQLDNGSYVEPRNLTLADLLDKWLTDSAGPNVTPKTLERYTQIVEKHLKSALGKIPLTKLHPLHIQDYYAVALSNGRIKGGGKLSPRTVLHHHRVLHRALKQGVKWQLLPRNPADAVDPPRAIQKEIRVIGEKDTAELLNVASDTRLHVPLLVAIATGLRRGELLALRWQDTDLSAGTLAVRQSVEQTTKAGLRFKPPKTRKGSRQVALPQFCLTALRSHKAAQAKERLAAGSAYTDQDLVFARPDGSTWRPDVFTRTYREIIRKTKFEGLRFHDLRHSHATQLLRQGVHPKVVSERLGHATIGITLDTYSHVLPDMQEAAAAKLDAALGAIITAGGKTGPSSR